MIPLTVLPCLLILLVLIFSPFLNRFLVLSQAALHRFYIGLREFLIESDQILAKEKPIPKHLYTNLCSKFMEIFMLNVRYVF